MQMVEGGDSHGVFGMFWDVRRNEFNDNFVFWVCVCLRYGFFDMEKPGPVTGSHRKWLLARAGMCEGNSTEKLFSQRLYRFRVSAMGNIPSCWQNCNLGNVKVGLQPVIFIKTSI